MKQLLFTLTIFLFSYTTVNAGQTKVDTVGNNPLKEVVITSNLHKFAISLGKAGIHPMDLPQTTFVVTAQTIQNQQISSISDLLKNVNGVYIMGTTGGYQEEIASRGSALSSSNTFKNGVRYFSGMRTEFSGIEKAEFLKGNAAILYGNVAPGGVLNLVTKKPRFNFGGEIGLKLGSYNEVKPTFDLFGSLNKSQTIAGRINASFEKENSFRKEVSSKSVYVNPSLLFKLGTNSQLVIEGDYLKDRRTPDFGAGIVNYQIVDLPRDRFLGVSWGYYDARQSSATATLTHALSEKWSLTLLQGWRNYSTELFSNARPNTSGSTVAANGKWIRNLQKSGVEDDYYTSQFDLKGKAMTGKIAHQLLVGGDFEQYKTKTTAYKAITNYDTINIFNDYNPSIERTVDSPAATTLTTTPVSRFGIYAQDLVSFTKQIKLLLGLRYSYQETKSEALTYATSAIVKTNNYDDAFSPRIGLIIQPTENHALFASYSNSFQVNTGTDINLKPLDPSIIDQYEIGLKNKFFHEQLLANITVYQITNSNMAQISLANGNTNSNIKELSGETRSRGLELDVIANPAKGLSVLAGYSFSETKYIKSNTYIEGSELRYNPKNTANLNFNYRFQSKKLCGLSAGLINSYVGERFAGRSTRLNVANDTYKLIPLSGYFQMDAVVSYDCKRLSIKSKISNITNAKSYNIHDDNSLNPIAPTNYSVTFTYDI